jgi:hypothetical protein
MNCGDVSSIFYHQSAPILKEEDYACPTVKLWMLSSISCELAAKALPSLGTARIGWKKLEDYLAIHFACAWITFRATGFSDRL